MLPPSSLDFRHIYLIHLERSLVNICAIYGVGVLSIPLLRVCHQHIRHTKFFQNRPYAPRQLALISALRSRSRTRLDILRSSFALLGTFLDLCEGGKPPAISTIILYSMRSALDKPAELAATGTISQMHDHTSGRSQSNILPSSWPVRPTKPWGIELPCGTGNGSGYSLRSITRAILTSEHPDPIAPAIS